MAVVAADMDQAVAEAAGDQVAQDVGVMAFGRAAELDPAGLGQQSVERDQAGLAV